VIADPAGMEDGHRFLHRRLSPIWKSATTTEAFRLFAFHGGFVPLMS